MAQKNVRNTYCLHELTLLSRLQRRHAAYRHVSRKNLDSGLVQGAAELESLVNVCLTLNI